MSINEINRKFKGAPTLLNPIIIEGKIEKNIILNLKMQYQVAQVRQTDVLL